MEVPLQDALRLFAALEPTTADWIFSVGTERTVAAGKAIASEGQELEVLTFVLDGLFAVHLSRNESAPVALLGPGELVGEISFLENLPATASVVAIEDSRVLCIARSDLLQRISADLAFATDFYRALARMLSRRLRERSLALAAGVGDRSPGGFMLTPAWLSLVAVLARFKELLWRADVAAEHSDRPIAPELVSDIQRMFEDLCQSLTELKLHITTDAALTEVEGALRREFTPYLHLTRVTRRVFTWPLAPEDRAGIEREAGFCEAGIVGQKTLEHGGFSGAVAAHEADSFAAQKIGRKSINDF